MNQVIVKKVKKVFDVSENKEKSFLGYLSQIGFSKKKIIVLEDISFNVKKGECLGIIGRNGSGKSTLLKLLAKTYTPTSGEIIVKGKVMPLLELGFGFQANLSGRENVRILGSLLGVSNKDINSKMKVLIDYFGFPDFIDRKLKSYSDGMKLRLAFATIMITNPDIILIDEGIVVGDYSFQLRSLTKIKKLKKEGKTIVIASHDFELIKNLCENTLCLENGKIIKKGPTQTTLTYYKEKLFEEDKKYLISQINSIQNSISNLNKKQQTIKIKEKEDELIQYVGELVELISLRIKELKEADITLIDKEKNDKTISDLMSYYKNLISKYI